MDFYIRADLEPGENVAGGEARSGGFEFYGPDSLIAGIYRDLADRYGGFFILESAKKHLEEIL